MCLPFPKNCYVVSTMEITVTYWISCVQINSVERTPALTQRYAVFGCRQTTALCVEFCCLNSALVGRFYSPISLKLGNQEDAFDVFTSLTNTIFLEYR